jgi:3-oxoacyl-[acyl-carrier protein] reductase
MTSEFNNRVALVTGASRGIGRACAIQLAQAGAVVAVNYRVNESAALETLEAVQAAGQKGMIVQADVSQQADVERMVKQVEEELGPVELLVNNAGVFDYVSHEDTTPDVWQRAIDNNLTSAYLVSWAVKRGMIDRGFGRIVNVASIAGLEAKPMCIAYAVSKAGMISLTKSLAATLAEFDIRVNAVAPGLTETEILDGVSQDQVDTLIAATPLKRIGQVGDISEVVTFLLSDRSSFMTGQTLVACGGRVMLP